MDEQAALAQVLRRATQGDALQGANQRANALNVLNAVTQMANNPGAARALQLATAAQQKQYAPVSLGQTGFALPGSGEFVESPMYVDEKNAARQARADALTATLESREEQARQKREADAQRDKDRADARREQQERDLEYRRDRDSQAFALRQTIAGLAAGRAADKKADKDAAAADKAAAKKAGDLDKGVTKFSNTLEKAGVPELDTALGTVEATLAKYKDGKLPGYGRLLSYVPDALADDETQVVRTNMQEAANMLLKARSGAAVTEPEQVRFLREVGSGKGMSEKALRNGWANIRKTFESKKDNLLSGASDEVLTEYNSRNPLQLNRRAKQGASAPATPAVDADQALIDKYLKPGK